MEASIQREALDRTNRADTTPNPEGSGLNTDIVAPPLPEPLRPMFQDVMTLFSNSDFNDFFSYGQHRRLQTNLGEKHHLVALLDTKNHLMWDFRKWAVKRIGTDDTALKELEFTATVMDEDAGNYHAWSHRRWVLLTFGGDGEGKLWKDELTYCDKIIKEDGFNSYAWDQRHFVVTRCLLEQEIDESISRKESRRRANKLDKLFNKRRSGEVDYAIEAIKARPENPCPWSYIRGLYAAYCGSMTLDVRVQEAILRVLEDEVVRLKFSGGIAMDDDGYVSSTNARGIINALNGLADLLNHGFYYDIEEEEGRKFRDAINALCPDSSSEDEDTDTVVQKILQILVHAEKKLSACGLAWRNGGQGVLAHGLEYLRLGPFRRAMHDVLRSH